MGEHKHGHTDHHHGHTHHHHVDDKNLAEAYDKKIEFINQGLISASILLSIVPDYTGLKDLDFTDYHLQSQHDIDDLLPNLPEASLFNRKGLDILDFACGTGLATSKLLSKLPHSSSVTGVDISEHMLAKFDEKFTDKDNVKSYRYSLVDEPYNTQNNLSLPIEFNKKFDIIYCTISYHHMENVNSVTERLCSLLKPGGYLIILDFYNPEWEPSQQQQEQQQQQDKDSVRSLILMRSLLTRLEMTNVFVTETATLKGYRNINFVKNHCVAKLHELALRGELETCDLESNGEKYMAHLVEHTMMLAIAQKK